MLDTLRTAAGHPGRRTTLEGGDPARSRSVRSLRSPTRLTHIRGKLPEPGSESRVWPSVVDRGRLLDSRAMEGARQFFITPGVLPTPEWLVRAGGGWHRFDMPITSGVLVRADGSVILVDGGFSAEEIERPRSLGLIRGLSFRTKGGRSAAAVAQLKARGIDPARVVAIVATHLHLDHIGAYADFPNAEVIAPAAEFASARRLGARAGYLHIEQIVRSGRALPVLLERADRHGFPGYKELFDGEILLLDAKGHTAGSVGVLMTSPDRAVLMAGDAAYSREEYRTASASPLMRALGFSQEWIRATWSRLADFEVENPAIEVVPSHCLDAFHAVAGCRHSASGRHT